MSMDLLGTYNGLLFLKVTNDDGTVRLFICNPVTRRVHQIQDFVLPMPTGRVIYDFGFNALSSSMYILGTERVRYITMQLMYDAKSQQYWWPVLYCPYVNVNTRFVGFVDNQFVMQYSRPLHVEYHGLSYRRSPGKSFIYMDSKNITGKTKQPLTPSLNLPSTKRSRGHEAENEGRHYTHNMENYTPHQSGSEIFNDVTNSNTPVTRKRSCIGTSSQHRQKDMSMNSMSPAMVPKEIYLSSATPHVDPVIVHNGSPHSNKLSQEYVDIGFLHMNVNIVVLFFGKVQLPKRQDPPKVLENLLVNNDSRRDLLPRADETQRFSQLYIYDTDNEVFNRIGCEMLVHQLLKIHVMHRL
ncbi:uncharacterized protein G2W53_044459 [Senna tora]|uniref:Uncharacterized protein n=1 Tax=Senna tora TaxID=362788 RepID=A0A834SEU5_9FABA|nr:uncharacterized protein G2W53_044459 [Senna tora]